MSVLSLQKALEILAFNADHENFFERAAEALSLATGYRWAAIFSLSGSASSVKAEAFWADGQLCKPFSFDLHGTPCHRLYNDRTMGSNPLYVDNIKTRYPDFDLLDAKVYQAALYFDEKGIPIGHIATLHDEVLSQTDSDRHFFHLLAQRIGAEYRHIQTNKQLLLHSQMVASTPHMMSFVDRQYIYRVVSQGYELLFDRDVKEIVGKSVAEMHGQRSFDDRIKSRLDACLSGETLRSRRWIQPRGRDPMFVDVNQAPCFDDAGNITGVITSAHDITEAKINEDRINEFAHKDPLTGLPNRRYLFERLEEEFAKFKRHGSQAVVFFIDLDGFKSINDKLGHAAGDEVLKVVAMRLKKSIRTEDILARIGGDEFVLLVPGASIENAKVECESLARKLLTEISIPLSEAVGSLVVNASIGIHPMTGDDSSSDEVINRADLAMYRAKQMGKNRLCFSD